jgi:hypothetical protein
MKIPVKSFSLGVAICRGTLGTIVPGVFAPLNAMFRLSGDCRHSRTPTLACRSVEKTLLKT